MSSDNIQLCKHFIDFITSVESRFRQSLNVNFALHMLVHDSSRYRYLLNTLFTSHDIDGIENSSNVIRANVEYIISFAFHHAMRSNVQFASRLTKVSFGSFKYRFNSFCTSSSASNQLWHNYIHSDYIPIDPCPHERFSSCGFKYMRFFRSPFDLLMLM